MDTPPSADMPLQGGQDATSFSKGVRGLAWFGLVLVCLAGGLFLLLGIGTWQDGGMDPYARILMIMVLAVSSVVILFLSVAPCAALCAEPANRCLKNKKSLQMALWTLGLAVVEWVVVALIPIHGSC